MSQAEGGTRSGLLWEVERILTELDYEHRPTCLLLENVPDLIERNFIHSWHRWLEKLEELGYTSYFEVLNGKDYGIPQNRRRFFCISIKGKYSYAFPKKIPLKYRLKDLLEDEVDEKYFLSEEHIKRVENWKAYEKPLDNLMGGDSISGTITTHCGKDSAGMKLVGVPNKVIKVGNYGTGHHAKDITSENGLSPTITTGNHGLGQAIAIKNATKKGYTSAEKGDGVDISSRMQHHRGTVQKGISQTLTCAGGADVGVVVNERKSKN